MSSTVEARVQPDDVAVGLVIGGGCVYKPSPPELEAAIARAAEGAAQRTDAERTKSAVRDLLRHGKYKPTGRAKPASEYLLRAASEGRFPRIGNLVDINNLVSLQSLLPISIIDLERAGTDTFTVRRGREGEAYVFNDTGQQIQLRDLLLVATAHDDRPCANPVKDAMHTKVDDRTTEVMAVIYAPRDYDGALREATDRFAEALRCWAHARTTERRIVTAEGSTAI